MSECICLLSAMCMGLHVQREGGGAGGGGCLNAGVAHVHMRCMSDDCSRQHGKYKIGQLLKMHCAEPSEKFVLEKNKLQAFFRLQDYCGFCAWSLGTRCFSVQSENEVKLGFQLNVGTASNDVCFTATEKIPLGTVSSTLKTPFVIL